MKNFLKIFLGLEKGEIFAYHAVNPANSDCFLTSFAISFLFGFQTKPNRFSVSNHFIIIEKTGILNFKSKCVSILASISYLLTNLS